jgi:hypothetical protein
MAEEIVSRDDVRAALSARKELGDDFDDALVESFARRVEERLKHGRPARRTTDERGMSLAAIAVTAAGLAGLIVAWAGIVLLNVLFARLR